jgi:hypothetical protein
MCLQPRTRVTALAMAFAILLAVGGAQASTQKQSPRPQAQGITGALWSWISPLLGVQEGSGKIPGAHAIWQQEGCTFDPNGGCINGFAPPGTLRTTRPKT